MKHKMQLWTSLLWTSIWDYERADALYIRWNCDSEDYIRLDGAVRKKIDRYIYCKNMEHTVYVTTTIKRYGKENRI